MAQDRRDFLKRTSKLGALALAAPLAAAASTAAGPDAQAAHAATLAPDRPRGMARQLILLSVRRNGQYRLAAKTPWGVLDISEAAKFLRMHAPGTMDEMLQNEDGPSVNAVVTAASKTKAGLRLFFREDRLEYGPVVARPEKIICVGLNYRRLASELGRPIPKQPVLFNKYNNALTGHYSTVTLPRDVKKFDYEAELVIIMGREAKNVSEASALSYVAGYSVGNDLSARDLQLETEGGQWMIGKTIDQFAPLGPYLVTADQIEPDNLMIECRVNGQTRQSSTTRDFIFNSRQLISYISRYITLKPGDIIFTGTPEGVIQGKPKNQQVWLKPGDTVACSVEKLSELQFRLA